MADIKKIFIDKALLDAVEVTSEKSEDELEESEDGGIDGLLGLITNK